MPLSEHTRTSRSARKEDDSSNSQGQNAEFSLGKFTELDKVIRKHEDHVRMLYHLEHAISLVSFDFDKIRAENSGLYRTWETNYDLWDKLEVKIDSRPKRRQLQQLKEEYQALVAANNVKTENAKVEIKTEKVVATATQRKSAGKSSATPQRRSLREPRRNSVKQEEPAKPVPARSSVVAKKPASQTKSGSKRQSSTLATPKRVVKKLKTEPQPEPATEFSDSSSDYESDFSATRDRELEDVLSLSERYLPAPVNLKLNYQIPPGNVPHPQFLTHQQHDGEIGPILESFKYYDEDDLALEDYNTKVQRSIVMRRKIAAAQESGHLDELLQASSAGSELLKEFQHPTKQLSQWDQVVSQAVALSKARANRRKFMSALVKKTSQAVESYFNFLAGSAERERKETERLLKQFARKNASDVMKKWKLAEKIAQQRLQETLDDQKKVQGKQYLNQILEQSAQLLESRVEQYEPENDTEDEEISESSGAESEKGTDSSAEASSDFSTTSDSESSADEGEGDDLNLTVEQLREKYKDALVDPAVEEPTQEALELYASIQGSESEEASNESDSEEESESESDGGSENSEDDGESAEDVGPSLTSLMAGNAAGVEEESGSDFEMSEDEESEAQPEDIKSDAEVDAEVAETETAVPDAPNSEPETPELVNSEVKEVVESDKMEIDSGAEENSKGLNRIKPPFLLRGTLRAYQRDGLDWLAGLYNTECNGILADEMGLGKTIQTISLLAYLACEKGIWGPHLIVVPTSVMLNWEMELKRFAPGFKVLTYYGNPQQRKEKRRGWNKEDTWHICITSYQLVIQDQVAFRRKRWCYMILDEAHNIKNFRSQRWQALLNFNTERRLLLTGTPLQNNLIELWSLLYFLMPSSKGAQIMPEGFANLDHFQEWFSRPVDQMVEEGEEADEEAKAAIQRLHQVLRPYLLRRLKVDVEKQMPGKYEHVIFTRLSKRQRYLYDDFMGRAATKQTLSSGNFMSILNCLMQLRKVCNHPNLFETRPILTSLAVPHSVSSLYQDTARRFNTATDLTKLVNFSALNLCLPDLESESKWHALTVQQLRANRELALELAAYAPETVFCDQDRTTFESWAKYAIYRRRMARAERLRHVLYLNMMRTRRVPLYGRDLRQLVTVVRDLHLPKHSDAEPLAPWEKFHCMDKLLLSNSDRAVQMKASIARYGCITPAVVCLDMPETILSPRQEQQFKPLIEQLRVDETFHESQVRLSIAFPDKRLLQYDCGKLQRMATLLRDLIMNNHRVLIFTQMTKVLDVLEQFLNIHGWRYLRLDGATRIEERQVLTERFNRDDSIPVFILSSRSGGLGINLTGADTVIFYDTDWNPAMDRQCQDRCHRIGQTRDVHIYRLISEFTIESNILKKATQKTILDNVVIQEGEFTTDYFSKFTVRDLLGDDAGRATNSETLRDLGANLEALAQAEDADDAAAANLALTESRIDANDFNDGAEATVKETTPAETPAKIEEGAQPEEEHEQEVAEIEDESNIGHVDDYMIRFVETFGLTE